MKWHRTFLLVYIGLLLCWQSSNCNTQETVHISSLTQAILHRYYFITRLTNTIILLQHIHKKIESYAYHNHTKLFDFDTLMHFQHPHITQVVEVMKKDKNLIPLFDVWHDFTLYKFIEDDLFTQDFTKALFCLSKNIFLQTKKNCRTFDLHYSSLSTSEQLLHAIDSFNEDIVDVHKNTDPCHHDIQHAHIDDVMSCFYYIKRLTDTIKVFKKLHHTQYYHKHTISLIKYQSSCTYDAVHFFHEKIIKNIEAMIRTHSLEPLLHLLQEIKQYRYIHDTNLMRELLMLICITHKQIIINTIPTRNNKANKSTLDTIISIGNKIDQLPIAELLNAIDMLVEELPEFLEKYEFNSDMTWKSWLKKYWWIPPLILGWFGLKFLVKFQRREYYTPFYYSLARETRLDDSTQVP